MFLSSMHAIILILQPSAPGAAIPTPISSGEQAAIFRAAGFQRQAGHWRSDCDDPGTPSYEAGAITPKGDLNGDGLPEALVTEGGTYCYGMAGTGFWLVSRRAEGEWKLMAHSTGIAEFLPTRGVGRWPDIAVGGPGFCFPVLRWDGREYRLHRHEYEGKPCRN